MTKPFGKYSFLALDATPDPGPKRPFNFFGYIRQVRDIENEKLGPPGASCSKLTMSLVNDSLKFQMAILQIHCICKAKVSHIISTKK